MSCKKSPVYDVRAVPVDKVVANDYNPNIVAHPNVFFNAKTAYCRL